MAAKPPKLETTDPNAPFGAQERRSAGTLIVLGLLYVCWLLVLLWMAAFHVGT